MSSCSIQNGGKRYSRHLKRGGKKTRKSYRGGNDLEMTSAPAPAPAPAPASAPAPAPTPAPEKPGFFSGVAKSFGAFTDEVGKRARESYNKLPFTTSPPKQDLASNSMPSEQTGGRRKKTKSARKLRKSRRLKRKRSRKSRK